MLKYLFINQKVLLPTRYVYFEQKEKTLYLHSLQQCLYTAQKMVVVVKNFLPNKLHLPTNLKKKKTGDSAPSDPYRPIANSPRNSLYTFIPSYHSELARLLCNAHAINAVLELRTVLPIHIAI